MTRGSQTNPPNPFERLRIEEDIDGMADMRQSDPDWQPPSPRTVFFRDDSQTLITKNNSPDVGFEASLNPYRGCEHGCAYCYARRTHEYLGFGAGLDFESKIMVKWRAPELLRAELSKSSWRPRPLACSGVTDCYQPVERKLRLTRGCLAVLAEFRNPVVLITKNHLITRDVDHLAELARWRAAVALVSVTTLDSELARILEPRASLPAMRLRAIRTLADAGIPVGASVAPVIPGLNDHEIPAILQAVADAGGHFASYSLVRLPGSVGPVFESWLDDHASPSKKATILARIRDVHGGRVNDLRWHVRMSGEGERAEQISQLFKACAAKADLDKPFPEVTTANFRRVTEGQIELF
ncbi:MAG: PA0069 family radical SAM protein [Verrucomicrobiales bacterium]